MPEPAAGTRLNGRYVLDGRIGLGGMSEVWRAADETLGRAVAVKILSGTAAEDPLLRAAIRREARAAARMTHPHAMHVYDYGEFSAGTAVLPYIVMELVDGVTLADRLADGPPLPWRAAARMAAEISAALADAHRLGVVHRDIKPANVMMTPSGAAKVLDFGIATLVTADPAPSSGTFTGHRPGGTEILDGWLAGTPPYAAPELLLRGEAGPPADVYAVGATLYQALTGQPPLAIASWEEASAVHRSGAAAPAALPGSVPESLAAACLACLSRDPEARPPAAVIARIFGGYAATAGGPAQAGGGLAPTSVAPMSPARGPVSAAPVSPAAAVGGSDPVVSGSGSRGPVSPGPGLSGSSSSGSGSGSSGAGARGPVSPGSGSGGPGFAPGAAAVPVGAGHRTAFASEDFPAGGFSPRGPAVSPGIRAWSDRLRRRSDRLRRRSDRLRGRRGVGVLAGGLIVGGVGLVALAALLIGPDRNREPAYSAPGGTAPATSATAPSRSPSGPPSRPSSRPPSPSRTPSAAAENAVNGTARAGTVLNRLDAALAQGLVSRDISARAGSRLFDDLSDLRRDVDDPEKLSDGASDLQERLERLADDGDMTDEAADNMIKIAGDLIA